MRHTLEQILRQAAATLAASPSPRLDAEVLALHVFGLSRAALMTSARATPAPAQIEQFLALIERRHRGEPIAYLTGRREFWSLDLAVSPATLIPRPETELVVQQALAAIPVDAARTVFDLGTGSGAIALAIAHDRPHAHVIATDCSREALAVAQTNAKRLGVNNVEFRHGDWLAPLAGMSADVIVSNPPYVGAGDPHLATGDVRFEPRTALVAGADGLDAIRHIVATASDHLREDGQLLLEHGPDQAATIAALLHRRGFADITCQRDLAGHDRVTTARR